MVQNRNKLISLFIGNVSNAVTHEILEHAILKTEKEQIADKYRKELKNSFELAKKYRDEINPKNKKLPNDDVSFIRGRIIKKVKSDLMTRIAKGYENIDLELIEPVVDRILKKIRVTK